jgi:hypothetical protein
MAELVPAIHAHMPGGIFVRRAVLEAIGGMRPIALMEDYDPVRRLRRVGPTACVAEPPLDTSSRRFAGRRPAAIVLGWVRVHLLWSKLQILTVGLLRGKSRRRRGCPRSGWTSR